MKLIKDSQNISTIILKISEPRLYSFIFANSSILQEDIVAAKAPASIGK